MQHLSAEIVVATAMRDRARELVAMAEIPEVVELATREWKRYQKRIDDLQHEEAAWPGGQARNETFSPAA